MRRKYNIYNRINIEPCFLIGIMYTYIFQKSYAYLGGIFTNFRIGAHSSNQIVSVHFLSGKWEKYTERKTDPKSRYFRMFESTFEKCLIQLSV